jgi:hypothetical protein
VASLTWVNFRKLISDRFKPIHEELREGMNFTHMKLTWPLKAYMTNFNNQINATPLSSLLYVKAVLLS